MDNMYYNPMYYTEGNVVIPLDKSSPNRKKIPRRKKQFPHLHQIKPQAKVSFYTQRKKIKNRWETENHGQYQYFITTPPAKNRKMFTKNYDLYDPYRIKNATINAVTFNDTFVLNEDDSERVNKLHFEEKKKQSRIGKSKKRKGKSHKFEDFGDTLRRHEKSVREKEKKSDRKKKKIKRKHKKKSYYHTLDGNKSKLHSKKKYFPKYKIKTKKMQKRRPFSSYGLSKRTKHKKKHSKVQSNMVFGRGSRSPKPAKSQNPNTSLNYGAWKKFAKKFRKNSLKGNEGGVLINTDVIRNVSPIRKVNIEKKRGRKRFPCRDANLMSEALKNGNLATPRDKSKKFSTKIGTPKRVSVKEKVEQNVDEDENIQRDQLPNFSYSSSKEQDEINDSISDENSSVSSVSRGYKFIPRKLSEGNDPREYKKFPPHFTAFIKSAGKNTNYDNDNVGSLLDIYQ